MLNLIKMDLRVMLRSVFTWVITAVAVCFVALMILMLNFIPMESAEEVPDAPLAAVQTEDESAADEVPSSGLSFSVSVDHVDSPEESAQSDVISLDYILYSLLTERMLLIFSVIFTILFVSADYKTGFIKNIAGQYPNKGVLIVSKAVSIAVYNLMLIALTCLSAVVFLLIAYGDGFTLGGDIAGMLKSTGIQYLLITTISYLSMLLYHLTRSVSFCMTACILATTNILSMVYLMINKAIINVFSAPDFNITLYLPTQLMAYVSSDSPADILLRAGIISVIFSAAYLLLASLSIKKRDII